MWLNKIFYKGKKLTVKCEWRNTVDSLGIIYYCRNKHYFKCCVCVCMYCHCSVTKLCSTLCDPIDCRPQGSSVHGDIQARIPERVVISYSRGSSQPRDWTCIGKWILHQSQQGSPTCIYMFCSVTESCPALCDPMGYIVHKAPLPPHHLLEFAQILSNVFIMLSIYLYMCMYLYI